MASTVSILRAKNGCARFENRPYRIMPTTPVSMKPAPRMKGGPTPNHDVPDAELAGYHRLSNDAQDPRQHGPPTSGNTEQEERLPVLQHMMAVEERHGEAVDAVVEGDRDTEGGDRVGQHVLAEQGQPDIPHNREAP